MGKRERDGEAKAERTRIRLLSECDQIAEGILRGDEKMIEEARAIVQNVILNTKDTAPLYSLFTALRDQAANRRPKKNDEET